jgi:hypothetical protein
MLHLAIQPSNVVEEKVHSLLQLKPMGGRMNHAQQSG